MTIQVFVDTEEEKAAILACARYLQIKESIGSVDLPPDAPVFTQLTFMPHLVVVRNKFGGAPPIQAKPLC